jgi:hypothetical protein
MAALYFFSASYSLPRAPDFSGLREHPTTKNANANITQIVFFIG